MILTGSLQQFETQFGELGCVSASGSASVPCAGERASSRSRTFLSYAAVKSPFATNACSAQRRCNGCEVTARLSNQHAKECATLLQLAKPAQSDGGLRIVGFVAAVKGADPDPLKSGAFD